jgi:signal transduction histidine kinase
MAGVLNFALALLELVLALIVLRHLGRFGRQFPWLAALMVFFFLRSADRFYVAVAGNEPPAFSALVDAPALVLLVLLLFGVDRTVHGLEVMADNAALRESEYERALSDYRRLMRHRIANPLAAVRAGIQSLDDLGQLSEEEKHAVIEAIHEAVLRLQRVSLDPSPLSREERQLEGRPRLGSRLEPAPQSTLRRR